MVLLAPLLIPDSSVASRSAAGCGIFSNGCSADSLNRVHKPAGQCLEAGAGVVLAGYENDVAEIIQKNGIPPHA